MKQYSIILKQYVNIEMNMHVFTINKVIHIVNIHNI